MTGASTDRLAKNTNTLGNSEMSQGRMPDVTLLGLMTDAVFVTNELRQIVFWNEAAEVTYGWSAIDTLGRSPDLLFGSDDNRIEAAIDDSIRDTNRWSGNLTRCLQDGRVITVACQRIRAPATPEMQVHVIDISRDTSQFQEQEAKLRDTARILQAVMDNTSSYIHVRDVNGRFLYVNEEYEKVFGVTSIAVIGKLIEDVFPKAIAALRREMHETVLRSPVDLHAEIVEKVDGIVRTFMDVKSPLFDDTGKVYAIYCIGTDITERKVLESRMAHLAHYDTVTELPNRMLFYDRVGEAIKKCVRSGQSIALLFLDLDRFKDVNDTLGHDTGDRLLKAVGQRLRESVRNCDTVARMGGDEFTIILENVHRPTEIEPIAQKILAALMRPFSIADGKDIYLTSSIGITISPQDAGDAVALLKNADHAMYASKRGGPGNYRFYTESMNLASAERFRIIADLKHALQDAQFRLVYQPIVCLSDGRVHKAEALIRWEHPVRGMINPIDFIPISEETGDVIAIGDWVFHEAVRQCSDWRRRFDPDFQISINTSPVQYRKDGINVANWASRLDAAGLHCNAIVVEITEGLLMDATNDVKRQLKMCSEAGIEIALDDFGTGYSSLSYLRKFKVDYLKIDRAFVTNLAEQPDDLVLCEAIIAMAHKLGLRVIAEGIESTLQFDLLLAAGCDYGQGYLFSKPVVPAILELQLQLQLNQAF